MRDFCLAIPKRAAICALVVSLMACGDDGGQQQTDAACGQTDAEFCQANNASCGTLEAVDSCGQNRSVVCGSCTFPNVCQSNTCSVPTGWFGIDGSDFAPWEELTRWHSAGGEGIPGSYHASGQFYDVEIAADGTIYAAWIDNNTNAATVSMFDGSAWTSLPVPKAGAHDIQLDLDSLQNLIAAVFSGNTLSLRRFDGVEWTDFAPETTTQITGNIASYRVMSSATTEASGNKWATP
jgi:hypothetical protein